MSVQQLFPLTQTSRPPATPQIVWKGTTGVGCGFAPSCGFVVCRYNPAGNILGYFGEYVSK